MSKITITLDLDTGRSETYLPGHGYHVGRSAQAVRFNAGWARMEDIWDGDEEAQQTGRNLRAAVITMWGDELGNAIGKLMAADFTPIEGDRG